MKRERSAFTVVELLVVLVIIALLAALLFPVLASVREDARRRVCVSNLHQIGIAVTLYRQDFDGVDAEVGVPMTHSQLGLPHSFSIDDFYNNYVKDRRLLSCPSAVVKPGLASSYHWALFDSEYNSPQRNFEAEIAARGDQYPLVVCYSHNGDEDIPLSLRQSSDIMYYQLLRLSNQVGVRIAPADAGQSPGNW